jgi:hypothetical protein
MALSEKSPARHPFCTISFITTNQVIHSITTALSQTNSMAQRFPDGSKNGYAIIDDETSYHSDIHLDSRLLPLDTAFQRMIDFVASWRV